MSDETPQPTPEEVEIIRKYCKHLGFIVNKSVEFLKPGENQILTCENCGLELERKIDWKKYVHDAQGIAPCSHCGGYILKGDEVKVEDDEYEYAHEKCEWPDF